MQALEDREAATFEKKRKLEEVGVHVPAVSVPLGTPPVQGTHQQQIHPHRVPALNALNATERLVPEMSCEAAWPGQEAPQGSELTLSPPSGRYHAAQALDLADDRPSPESSSMSDFRGKRSCQGTKQQRSVVASVAKGNSENHCNGLTSPGSGIVNSPEGDSQCQAVDDEYAFLGVKDPKA